METIFGQKKQSWLQHATVKMAWRFAKQIIDQNNKNKGATGLFNIQIIELYLKLHKEKGNK